MFPQDGALETHLKANDAHQPSGPCALDDSVISLCGSSQYKSLPEPGFFSPVIPRVAVTDYQAEVEGSCLHHVQGSATNKACSLMKEVCLTSVPDAPACVAAVQQTLHVSSTANASSSVVSASSIIETKMVRQSQPEEWQSDKRSVACNTAWSCGQQCRDAQRAAPGSDSGRPLSTGCLKPSGNSLNEVKSIVSNFSSTLQILSCANMYWGLRERC